MNEEDIEGRGRGNGRDEMEETVNARWKGANEEWMNNERGMEGKGERRASRDGRKKEFKE